MAGDGWLTTGRKLQLKIIFYGILLAGLVYTVIGLLNGFQYANQLITEYPIPILIYTVLLIAAIPFYRKNDELIRQIIYQIGWSGSVILIPAISAFLYYSFNPPTTGVGRITLTFSKMLVWITGSIVFGNLVFAKKKLSKQ
jgi:hypothetical protein